MDAERLTVTVVVVAVIAVSLLSGPLAAGIDLSQAPDQRPTAGTGSATVEVVSVPETVRLEKGSFNADAPYTLLVPDATVELSNISGGPLLVYKLRMPALGYTRGTTHFLDASMDGRQSVTLDRTTVDKDLTRDQYRGEFLLILRGDGTERTLYRGNTTVEVTR